MDWEEILAGFNFNNNYGTVSEGLELSIIDVPTYLPNYHHLGLAYLLQNQTEKSQEIWDLGYKYDSSSSYWHDLFKILEKEANHQEKNQNYAVALNIRQAIRKFLPNEFNNLVQIFYLSLHLNLINSDTLQELNLYEVTDITFSGQEFQDKNLLLQLVLNILSSELSEDIKLDFVSFSQQYFSDKEKFFNYIVPYSFQLTANSAFKLLEIIQNECPNHLAAFSLHNQLLGDTNQYDEAIRKAREYLITNQDSITAKVVANHLLLATLLSFGSKWQDAVIVHKTHESLISQVISEELKTDDITFWNYFLLSSFFNPYLSDNPNLTRLIQNQVSTLFQNNFQRLQPKLVERFQNNQSLVKGKIKNRKIKIGFLSITLREHSVGWLARFLVDNLDRETFELYGYFPQYMIRNDFLQTWYRNRMHKVFQPNFGYFANFIDVANEIADDEIDILVDLESITSALCSQILALKPAPIQVTWLGWDAPGLPAVDYFIADPYVLPQNAQDYYSEKIWRLPNTYIAVDGFESVTATLTREHLEIPSEAVVYFSSQKSYKRHPETVELQMEILKCVPNSYFLIKGLGKEDSIKEYFYQMADAKEVSREQLRFLPYSKDENEHRGNLALVDVVLDTYPYSGATTTMEVLWMGIPLVTRVGEQFVARNSYAMLMNVGVSEGIAYTPEEYVNWGVRFGTEPDLRREVAWKLRQSRKTSPLWNGRQFAKDIGNAFKEMWEIYNG